MQSLAFSYSVKGQRMNIGCGKEATAAWLDPLWFCDLHASWAFLAFLSPSPDALGAVSGTSVEWPGLCAL